MISSSNLFCVKIILFNHELKHFISKIHLKKINRLTAFIYL